MKQVFIICEGQTELAFVKSVLSTEMPRVPLLGILSGKLHNKPTGGSVRYSVVRKTILAALKQNSEHFCTTFLDFYALSGFPGQGLSQTRTDPEGRAAAIERAVEEDIQSELGSGFNPQRFRAYLSMYEFEALLFSDPVRMATTLSRPDLVQQLHAIRTQHQSPEHIDDGRETAPSKRLLTLIPTYNKVTDGSRIAASVGLGVMKRECAHFRSWVEWIASR